MNKLCQFVTASVAAASMFVGGQAYSHGMWFTERSSQLAVIYGVGADDLDTVKRFDKITSITGYDSDWNEVDAQLIKAGPMVLVGGDDYPDAVSAVMNNGIWAKTKDGKWHAKGRDEVPDAVTALKTMKYAVHIRGMLRDVPVINSQTLQIVPVKGAPALKNGEYNLHGDKMPAQAGDLVKVAVLYKGNPVEGARVIRDFVTMPDQQPWVTGKDGTVYFPVRNQGLNVIGASYDGPADEPNRIDKVEHFATLSFVLKHLPE
tara:strand:- start:176 stop:958 length:783 start_codon:yes stop_codon:yes gene_type:complete